MGEKEERGIVNIMKRPKDDDDDDDDSSADSRREAGQLLIVTRWMEELNQSIVYSTKQPLRIFQ